MTPPDRRDADAIWREWLNELLAAAADQFGLKVTGAPTYGWRDRSIGAEAVGRSGRRWLRVVTEDERWAEGDFWTGNADAAAVEGVSKPIVLATAEWQVGPRKVRAEEMTLIPGRPCSPTDVLNEELELPPAWWEDLRRSLDALALTPTSRVCVSPQRLVSRVRTQLGIDLDPDAVMWTTVHGDVHWANMHAPTFALLDWEGWGSGPVGTDGALLYCYSLLQPRTARRVFDAFGDVLARPEGRAAQLHAIARLLSRAEKGDHPDLVAPLRARAALLATATSTRG